MVVRSREMRNCTQETEDRIWQSGAHSRRNRSEVPLPQRIEAIMLFKIKGVRRDLREFSGPTRLIITLNLKSLSDGGGWGRKYAYNSYVRSPNVIENNEA